MCFSLTSTFFHFVPLALPVSMFACFAVSRTENIFQYMPSYCIVDQSTKSLVLCQVSHSTCVLCCLANRLYIQTCCCVRTFCIHLSSRSSPSSCFISSQLHTHAVAITAASAELLSHDAYGCIVRTAFATFSIHTRFACSRLTVCIQIYVLYICIFDE